MMLFKGFIQDMIEWKRKVLIEQSVDDIHYLDKSFYANISQLDISLNEEEDEDESELEFF